MLEHGGWPMAQRRSLFHSRVAAGVGWPKGHWDCAVMSNPLSEGDPDTLNTLADRTARQPAFAGAGQVPRRSPASLTQCSPRHQYDDDDDYEGGGGPVREAGYQLSLLR
jgi:hypothetical protein